MSGRVGNRVQVTFTFHLTSSCVIIVKVMGKKSHYNDRSKDGAKTELSCVASVLIFVSWLLTQWWYIT